MTGHPHDGRAHDPLAVRCEDRRRLWAALGITLGVLLAEMVGGLMSHSLALLADAGHVLADAGALAVALFAQAIACRPATPQKTFGYYRIEILSALFNGVVLIVIAGSVLVAAWSRLGRAPAVHTGPLLWVAAFGLAGNVVAAMLLAPGARRSLNLRGALGHVLGDAISSVGVLAGGVVMARTGWYRLDALLSMGIALIILAGAWRLLREAVDVLLEAVPGGLDPEQVARAITEVPGVDRVHDLHIWSITSGMPALSGHVIASRQVARHPDELLNRVKRMLLERYRIEHTTLQIESPDYEELGHVH